MRLSMHRLLMTTVGLTALLAGSACRGETSTKPPIQVFQNMYRQPRYAAQSYSAFFEDKRTMRVPVEGTVARELRLTCGHQPWTFGNVMDVVDRVPAALLEEGDEQPAIEVAA